MKYKFKNAKHTSHPEYLDCDIFLNNQYVQNEWVPHTVYKQENPEFYDLVLASKPKPYVKPDFNDGDVDMELHKRITTLWNAYDIQDAITSQINALTNNDNKTLLTQTQTLRAKAKKLKQLTQRKDVDVTQDKHWI